MYIYISHCTVNAGAVANFFEGGKSVPILLDDIKCTGEEATLFECSRTNVGRHNCQHNEDAGVVCTSESSYLPDSVCYVFVVLQESRLMLAAALG